MPDYFVNVDTLSIEELRAYIAELNADKAGSGCRQCAANRLNAKIRTARRRLQRLERERGIAEARAAEQQDG